MLRVLMTWSPSSRTRPRSCNSILSSHFISNTVRIIHERGERPNWSSRLKVLKVERLKNELVGNMTLWASKEPLDIEDIDPVVERFHLTHCGCGVRLVCCALTPVTVLHSTSSSHVGSTGRVAFCLLLWTHFFFETLKQHHNFPFVLLLPLIALQRLTVLGVLPSQVS